MVRKLAPACFRERTVPMQTFEFSRVGKDLVWACSETKSRKVAADGCRMAKDWSERAAELTAGSCLILVLSCRSCAAHNHWRHTVTGSEMISQVPIRSLARDVALTPQGDSTAKRCRTCRLRANKDSRSPRYLIFRSIRTPRNRCTLRDHRRQWPCNTRYQADATFTWAGLAPAGSHQLCPAHSIDHSSPLS